MVCRVRLKVVFGIRALRGQKKVVREYSRERTREILYGVRRPRCHCQRYEGHAPWTALRDGGRPVSRRSKEAREGGPNDQGLHIGHVRGAGAYRPTGSQHK
eukprot:8329226-Alexandrium_andersonii.AAC.1